MRIEHKNTRRIAVVGVLGTGKSLCSLSLSYLSGYPVSQMRTNYELKRDLFMHNNDKELRYSDCLLYAQAAFSERIVNEFIEESFISDGSVLNELVFCKAFFENDKNRFVNRNLYETITNYKSKYERDARKMLNAFENIVMEHFVNTYDNVICLSPEFVGKTAYSTEVNKFRALMQTQLIALLDKYNVSYGTFNFDNMEQAIDKIAEQGNITAYLSAENAVYKAKTRTRNYGVTMDDASMPTRNFQSILN